MSSGKAVLIGLLALAAAPVRAGALLESHLAVVYDVGQGGNAAGAGVQPGDRVVRLGDAERPSLSAVMASMYAWSNARDTELGLQREAERVEAMLPQGDPGWTVGPEWNEEGAARYQALASGTPEDLPAATLALTRDLADEATSGWLLYNVSNWLQEQGLAEQAAALRDELEGLPGDGLQSVWKVLSLRGRASTAAAQGQLDEAESLYRRAVEQSGSLGEISVSNALGAWHQFELDRGGLERAKELGEQALEIRRRLAPGSLVEAFSLNGLGIVAEQQGRLDVALRLFEQSLQVKQRRAPGSWTLANTLNNVANVLRERGDLKGASQRYNEALELYERLAPDGVDVASALGNLGIVAERLGDLETARRHHARSLDLYERLEPDGMGVANAMTNLGSLGVLQGDVAAGVTSLRGALAIYQRLAPDSLALASVLTNLGTAAQAQGDLEGALQYYLQALALRERLAPDSLAVEECLNNLGGIAYAKEDLEGARDFWARGLALTEKLAPDRVEVAGALLNLGDVAWDLEDLEGAMAYYRQARDAADRLAPGSLLTARLLGGLGMVVALQGRLDEAEAAYRAALRILERLAPGSLQMAQVLHNLGFLAEARGKLPEARELHAAAADALEAQRERVGEALARTSFAERSADVYHALATVEVALGEPAAALRTLERSRARALLEMMAERNVKLPRLPEALERRRSELRQKRQRLARSLAGADDRSPPEEVRQWQAQYALLDSEEDALALELRRAVPELASMVDPRPLGPEQLAAAVPPGTLALVYSVGRTETLALALPGGASKPRAVTLPLGRKALSARVQALRRQIQKAAGAGQASGAAAGKQPWKALATALYQDLVDPFEAELSSAQRLLILPDGPLHLVPFAALPPASAPDRPLVQRLAIGSAPSLTLYRELRAGTRPAGAGLWVGLGDPDYRRQAAPALAPLPGTRAELEACGRLFGARARVLLGAEAAEAAVRSLAPGASMLHLACHGRLDERFPMNSGLALSPPAGDAAADDGLLQAWEIIEDLRLDSDLVVLSACETGLGRLQGGEGLVGLSRAFLHAGARSLVVSLWSIADESTALLMAELYRGLLQGLPKDEALRQAQIRLSQDERFADPFYWAAFQLIGAPDPLPPREQP